MKVDYNMLESLDACREEAELFYNIFGSKKIEVTKENIKKADDAGLDVYWLTDKSSLFEKYLRKYVEELERLDINKIKPGDAVKVKDNPPLKSYPPSFVAGMEKYKGQTIIVDGINCCNERCIKACTYYWHSIWLEEAILFRDFSNVLRKQ